MSNDQNPNKSGLEQNIHSALDEGVDNLDANTLSRIRQVRTRALESKDIKSFNWFGVMSAAVAMTCVLVLVIMIAVNNETTVQPIPVEDLDLISSTDDLQLYQDLEFYLWLTEHET